MAPSSPYTPGRIAGTPVDNRLRKKRRSTEFVVLRVEACKDYAESRSQFRSIESFISHRKGIAVDDEWKPSKGQMVRDKRALFGKDWPALRGGGGNRSNRWEEKAESAPGLTIPSDAVYLLEPSCRPTFLSGRMEEEIISTIVYFQEQFGVGIVTPMLIQSVAVNVVMLQGRDRMSESSASARKP